MNKRRFAAFAATVLIFVGLLFGQGPIQKVRLWDTNLSHSLLLNWNEDRAAGYTLNWIGITADRTITLQGNPTLDDWFDQSVKTTFSPTFVTVKLSALTDGYVPYHVSDATGLANSVIRTDGTLVGVGMLPTVAQLEVNTSQIITSTTAAPYLKLINASDTTRDPIIQFAVGATPVTKFTMGIDDSDNDTWKLSVGDILGDDHDVIIISSEGGVPGVDEFTLIDTFATAVKMRGVCTDGTYIYCVSGEYGNTKIYKYDITDGTLLDTSLDTNGAANGGRCATDGTHVYVLCTSYVKKYLCTNLSYVASSDSWTGVSYLSGIYYWAGHVYITNVSVYNARKIRCSDMGTVWTTTFTQGAGANQTNTARTVATDGQFVYIQDCEINNRIIRLNMDGTWYDATDVVKPLSYVYPALWCAGDYLYILAAYAANDYYVEKRNKSDLSISESFDVLNKVTQGCQWGDYHYLVSIASTGIYKYQYATSSASAPAKTRFRLKNAYGQYVDIATLTADVRLGVGTTIPSETIEAVGNIKAQAGQFISTMATGTAPAVVSSTTVCTNLNAGLVDGYHHDQSLLIAASPTFVALKLSATSNQIVLQSAGVTGTITATPASSNKVWTLQDVTGTIYQTGGTDVAVADGGTGLSSYAVGDLLYASAGTTLAGLADVAVGSYLASGGVTTAPAWATLNQAAVAGLTTADGPTWDHVHIVGGTDALFSTYRGANSDGYNIFIGGGGQSSVGEVGATYKGSYNISLGVNALLSNTTGYKNIAHGAGSLQANTTGFYNVGIGLNALLSNTAGSANTIIGAAGLKDLNITANDGSGANTAIGFNTGLGIVTGINNTILGANVTGLATALSNNIILANGAGTIKAQHDNTNWEMTGGLHATTGLFDHIGEHTGAHTVVFDNTVTLGTLAGVLKGTAGVVSAITTTTSADYLGGDAAYHTLNQAAVAGLTTTDGPTWDHVHVSAGPVDFSGTVGTYHLDTTPATIYLANNGTVDFPSMSGMIIVNDCIDGYVTLFLCGGGATAAVGSAGAAVRGTLTYNAGIDGYSYTNTSGAQHWMRFAVIRTRSGS